MLTIDCTPHASMSNNDDILDTDNNLGADNNNFIVQCNILKSSWLRCFLHLSHKRLSKQQQQQQQHYTWFFHGSGISTSWKTQFIQSSPRKYIQFENFEDNIYPTQSLFESLLLLKTSSVLSWLVVPVRSTSDSSNINGATYRPCKRSRKRVQRVHGSTSTDIKMEYVQTTFTHSKQSL